MSTGNRIENSSIFLENKKGVNVQNKHFLKISPNKNQITTLLMTAILFLVVNFTVKNNLYLTVDSSVCDICFYFLFTCVVNI